MFACAAMTSMLLACSACEKDEQTNWQDYKPDWEGQTLGSSISDYASKLLNDTSLQPAISDWQRPILEKTHDKGVLDSQDYEAAWAGYVQCMSDRGYPRIRLLTRINGLKVEAPIGIKMSSEQMERYTTDKLDCTAQYTEYVEDLYAAQVDNPRLLKDPDEIVVDCYKRYGLMAQDYSMDRYYEQMMTDPNDLPKSSPRVLACQAAAGITASGADDPAEEVW